MMHKRCNQCKQDGKYLFRFFYVKGITAREIHAYINVHLEVYLA